MSTLYTRVTIDLRLYLLLLQQATEGIDLQACSIPRGTFLYGVTKDKANDLDLMQHFSLLNGALLLVEILPATTVSL